MGVIPSTRLLLVRNGMVLGHFSNYDELASVLPISINNLGQITFDGEKVNPSYVLLPDWNGWSSHDAIKDWVRNHFGSRRGYQVYRYLTY